MLRADGMTPESFMPLWRDAMWHTPDPAERVRLVLELGRLNVHHFGKADPLVIGYAQRREPPFLILSLREPPTHANASVRASVQTRLAEVAATEVYVVLTLATPGAASAHPGYLLAAWAETLTAPGEPPDQHCWLQPFRWTPQGLEEAEAMPTPDPSATELSRHLAGLLTPRH